MMTEENPPILVLGAGGQVGTALMRQLRGKAIPLDKEQADFANPSAVLKYIQQYDPLAIINAAAYTAVDKAEEDKELCRLINAETPGVVAEWACEEGIPFVHYSTDYVYPGGGEGFWKETDQTGPLSHYGLTKLQGDQRIQNAEGLSLIFRTSWVFDEHGKNFVNTMLRLGAEREELRVVADQIGAPTYADDIAYFSLRALEHAMQFEVDDFPTGIFHLANSGLTSWHGFANKIFELAREYHLPMKVQNVVPITSAEYPTPAKRPLNSRLDMTRLKDVFGIEMPSWEDALDRCFAEKFPQQA
ncbi:MAG: dTDP-4-dehydrorhamnose reductase [Proteobacteria bacterium]|nr:dTDP-4-dehydrorhamnose reductase [Pseudomonadota bacterium]